MKKLIILIACVTFCSCNLFRKTQKEIYKEKIVTVTQIDTVIAVPSARVDTLIKFDSIISPIYIEDKSSQAKLRILRTEYDQLLISCTSEPDTIIVYKTVTEFTDIQTQDKQKETKIKYNYLLLILSAIGVLSIILKLINFINEKNLSSLWGRIKN